MDPIELDMQCARPHSLFEQSQAAGGEFGRGVSLFMHQERDTHEVPTGSS
jgi:hypothetical protein